MIETTIPLLRSVLDPRSRTLIMGIINTTPDSFSDGGVHYDPDTAVNSAMEMIEAGADIVDVGGESSRPGSEPVTEEEELRRTEPVIREIIRRAPDAVISIDTRRSGVARKALDAGAQILNDITGFRDDPDMVRTAAESGAAIVIMHMLGTPKTMQKEIRYASFPGDIPDFFAERIETLEAAGVEPNKIIIDPGIGFGKTFDQNLALINRLVEFRRFGKPLLLGASRKAFLGKVLDLPKASDRDPGSAAVVTAGILRGADIVRVHHVPYGVTACKVADAVLREKAVP